MKLRDNGKRVMLAIIVLLGFFMLIGHNTKLRQLRGSRNIHYSS